MPTNDFLPIATGGAANVISQAQYAALTSLLTSGFQTGTISSAQVNKVWRQASIMAAVLAQFIVDTSGANATDDGTTATLLANLKASVNMSGTLQYADATGTVDAVAATYPRAAPTLVDGYTVLVGTLGANTSTAPTFTPTIGGALQATRTVVKFVGGVAIPLGVGDLQGVAILTYDLPNTRWVLTNVPSTIPALTSIALTNVDVTLTPTQYACTVLFLSGTLTGNVNLILPNIVGQWLIVNTCTGAFNVTVKTSAGSGYVIPNGANGTVYGNGTLIDLAEETAAVSLSTDPTLADSSGKTVSSDWIRALSAALIPAGTLIDFAGVTAPSGYLACPVVATNVSRTTYAALFAAIGTTWGVGDGTTTFGLPYFPADYASVQASANVGSQTVGQVITHSHQYMDWRGGTGGTAASAASSGSSTAGLTTTLPTGGSANLAAGVRVLKCVKI